jgi:hypothetical protein
MSDETQQTVITRMALLVWCDEIETVRAVILPRIAQEAILNLAKSFSPGRVLELVDSDIIDNVRIPNIT